MEIVRFAEAPFYAPPDHEEVTARRLQGGEASAADFSLVGHSIFPAGAVIPMGAGPIGKIYVVTEGSLVVEGANGEQHSLDALDSIFIAAGETRTVRNESNATSAMIVVTPPNPAERVR